MEEVKKTVINYYYNGISDNNEQISKDVCARLVTTDLKDGHPQYFIKMDGGDFFDPTHISPRYLRKPWKLRRVTPITFKMYLLYLGHPDKKHLGQKTYKHKAEREI